ncbi:MAG: hypothetical protein O3C60_10000 [Planctomycetota bacterium]|nr:hypothetical protein [Planctomycetota bacterium]
MSNVIRIAGILGLLGSCMQSVQGQGRVQFLDPRNAVAPAPNNLNPYNAVPPGTPGASLGPGIQPFDPYAMPGPPGRALPLPPLPSNGLGTPPATMPWGAPPLGPPGWNAAGTSAGGLPPAFPAPGFPANVPPNPFPPPSGPGYSPPFGIPGGPPGPLTPLPNPAGLPGTAPWPGTNPVNPGGPANPPPGVGGYGGQAYGSGPPYRRLFEHTGFRHTWLPGSDGNELEIHESEVSTTGNFANFLGTANGLRVTPGFVVDFLDGPSPPTVQDLPSRLYGAYLDFGLNPQFTPQLSGEINARVGVYSDYQTFTNDSLRTMGAGLGVYRINEFYALKLGAAYIDRAKIKLLPAAGVVWTPDDRTRWNLVFPSPKMSRFWNTFGNTDVWLNLGAEYGGGSWTMERPEDPAAGASERIDINDIRVFTGLEWTNGNRYYGFLEAGYVFDREIVYVLVPEDSISLKNTFMVRGGISF